MKSSALTTILMTIILIATIFLLGYLLGLIIKALKMYIRSKEVRHEKAKDAKSLGEVLKKHRVNCKMTQEFVAESLGVSRQAVSKWESGLSDPNTTNLISLGRLFGVTAESLLKEAQGES